MNKIFVTEIDIDEPLWDKYNAYSCAQLKEKYKDTYIKGGLNQKGIKKDIWIPKTYDEWFKEIKFPKIGKKK
jgi:hypothetical protein